MPDLPNFEGSGTFKSIYFNKIHSIRGIDKTTGGLYILNGREDLSSAVRGGLPPSAYLFSSEPPTMYILYLDESGTHTDARHFVLAGIAVFEREIHWFAQDMDNIQRRYFPELTEPLEFHASSLRPGGRGEAERFNSLTKEQRLELIHDIYSVVRDRRGILFGCVIEKRRVGNEEKCYARAFEDLVSRFDLFVRRYNRNLEAGAEEQRGILAIAESSYRQHLETLSGRFMGDGTRWGQLHAIVDVPFFSPAKNTRLLQIADFCSNAIYARYEHGYAREFDIIAPKFDREGSRIHGLLHLTSDHQCMCLACAARQPQLNLPG